MAPPLELWKTLPPRHVNSSTRTISVSLYSHPHITTATTTTTTTTYYLLLAVERSHFELNQLRSPTENYYFQSLFYIQVKCKSDNFQNCQSLDQSVQSWIMKFSKSYFFRIFSEVCIARTSDSFVRTTNHDEEIQHWSLSVKQINPSGGSYPSGFVIDDRPSTYFYLVEVETSAIWVVFFLKNKNQIPSNYKKIEY